MYIIYSLYIIIGSLYDRKIQEKVYKIKVPIHISTSIKNENIFNFENRLHGLDSHTRFFNFRF